MLADEHRGLPRGLRLLGTGEALDERRQTVGRAAADDPLEQASVLVRDVELRVARTDIPARVGQAEQVAVRHARALAVLHGLVGERVHRPSGVPLTDRTPQRAAPATE